MTGPGIGHVQLLVVGREAQAVGLVDLVGQLGDLPGLGINAVDRFLLQWLHAAGVGLVALVVHQAPVTGIGEPDRPVVGVNNRVVGSIQLLAVDLVRQHGDRAVVLVTDHAAVAVLAGNLAARPVERVAVGIARGVAERADVPVLFQVPHLDVVGNVAPEQVATHAIPRRALGPEHVLAVVNAADGRVAELVLLEAVVDHDDVGIGVADRRCVLAITGPAPGRGAAELQDHPLGGFLVLGAGRMSSHGDSRSSGQEIATSQAGCRLVLVLGHDVGPRGVGLLVKTVCC